MTYHPCDDCAGYRADFRNYVETARQGSINGLVGMQSIVDVMLSINIENQTFHYMQRCADRICVFNLLYLTRLAKQLDEAARNIILEDRAANNQGYRFDKRRMVQEAAAAVEHVI